VGKKKPSFSEKLGFLSGYTHHLNRERKESHDAKNVLLILSSVSLCLGIVFTTLMSCGGCGISVDMDAKYTEPLDWAFDGTGVSIIDAQTSNGAISFGGSTQS